MTPRQILNYFHTAQPFRFAQTYCSNCGGAQGPGNSGYSRCKDHKAVRNA